MVLWREERLVLVSGSKSGISTLGSCQAQSLSGPRRRLCVPRYLIVATYVPILLEVRFHAPRLLRQ